MGQREDKIVQSVWLRSEVCLGAGYFGKKSRARPGAALRRAVGKIKARVLATMNN
jgi:hypothetical protein